MGGTAGRFDDDAPSMFQRVRLSRVVMSVRYGPDDGTAIGIEAPASSPGTTVEAGHRRLSRSWDREPGAPFPSYDSLWPSFAQDLDRVEEWCRCHGLEVPAVERCELSYVNAVTAEEEWDRRRELERTIMRALSQELGGDFLPAAEGVNAEAQFAVRGSDGLHTGRLDITVSSVTSEANDRLLGLTLSASGPVVVPGREGVGRFFDAAFEWVVRGFASVAADLAGRL